ncbi:hypothetical protein QE152_g29238 [Popillia japonica]|uniref:Integrase catalytic domain-containing protein n=1 Tax=Popillia japonica TaxID=7064 RepID=A0AAW1JIT8_POPJA
MRADVTRYVRKCTTCLRSKPEQRASPGDMGGHFQVSKPWEVLSIDLVGPLPKSKKGYCYILVVCDLFSKFSMCYPLRKANATLLYPRCLRPIQQIQHVLPIKKSQCNQNCRTS